MKIGAFGSTVGAPVGGVMFVVVMGPGGVSSGSAGGVGTPGCVGEPVGGYKIEIKRK